MQKEDINIDDLVIDFLSGNISDEDQLSLANLLKSNEQFKDQFDELVKLRSRLMVPEIELGKGDNYKKLQNQLQSEPKLRISNFQYFKRFAAVAALLISISVAVFYIVGDVVSPDKSNFCYETSTPFGSQTKIILPDSTVVWLNSGSSLKYNQSFAEEVREVFLLGEAYFEVKKDKSKPFLVHTTELDVKVLGTTFNVRAYNDDQSIEVDLIKGIVNVSLAEIKNIASVTMKPNERLVYNKHTNELDAYTIDASRSALWKTGRLCFVDATVEQISKDLERKYDVKIHINNDEIKSELFSGSLNLNLSLKEILTYIDVDKKFRIIQTGDTIIIR